MNRWPALLLYLTAMAVLSSTLDPRWLGGGMTLWLLLARRDAWRLLRRAALGVALFNLGVSLGWILSGWWSGQVDYAWLAWTNLRVLLLTACTLLAAERIAWRVLLRRWPRLLATFELIQAQIRVFRRVLDELRMGLRSRSPRRAGRRVLLRHAAASGAHLLERSLHQADEIGLAMRARGVRLDRR